MKNSIVVTTYNGAKYIIIQLDSIKNQTLPPDEVIISDDGSKDDTPRIVANYIKENNLQNWNFRINKKNKGFFDNFIDTIKECTGDIIYLADQDDIWNQRKIEVFSNFYSTHERATMIQSNRKFIDGYGQKLPSKEFYHGKKMSANSILLTTEDMFKFAGSGYTMSFRRNVSDKVFEMGFNKKKDVFVFHDLLLGQMAALLGECYLMTDVIDYHRLHSANETQQKGKSFLIDRTKQTQIDILRRRCRQCQFMLYVSGSEDKENLIKGYLKFTQHRLKLIEKHASKSISYLIKNSRYYVSKKGIVADIMYALGFEKFLLCLYKKL